MRRLLVVWAFLAAAALPGPAVASQCPSGQPRDTDVQASADATSISDQVTLLQGSVVNRSDWAVKNVEVRVWVWGPTGTSRSFTANVVRPRLEPGQSTSWSY